MSGNTGHSLRRRLAYTDQDGRDKPWLAELDQVIRENPDCERGVMVSQGWVYSDQGPGSAGQKPELLVQVTQGLRDGPHGATWYGHVFRFIDGNDTGHWIALLARTWIYIDADSPQAVLEDYQEVVVQSHKWEPGYRQKPDDIASRHDTFEEAVGALIGKIRIFRRNLRDPRIESWEEPWEGVLIPIEGPVPDSERDLSGFDVYGFAEALCRELKKERSQS